MRLPRPGAGLLGLALLARLSDAHLTVAMTLWNRKARVAQQPEAMYIKTRNRVEAGGKKRRPEAKRRWQAGGYSY